MTGYDDPFLWGYALFLTILIGLCFGSFLNCMALRYVREESVLGGRSRCPHCGHALSALDLIPLFGYLFARGHCRYCKEKISARYLAAELLFAFVLAAIFLRHGISLDTLRFWILAGILLPVCLIDLKTQLIPNRFIAAGVLCFVFFCLAQPETFLWRLCQGLYGSLLISAPLLLLVLLADKLLGKESMGGGDLKLFFVCGLFFNWQVNLLMLLLACILGLLFALLVAKTKPGAPFPFGPAIAASCFCMMLFGPELVARYLSLFGL